MAKKKNSILTEDVETSAEQTADVVENTQNQETDATKSLEIEGMALEKLNDYIEEIERLKTENAKLLEKNNELLLKINEMAYEISQKPQTSVSAQTNHNSLKNNLMKLQEMRASLPQSNSLQPSRKKAQQQLRRHVSYNTYRNNGYSNWN